MFLSRKRRGASFLIMVVIMALVMSMFAVSVSQLTRTRSATLISDATEKQVLYLAESAANQMILRLNSGSTAQIDLTTATALGPNYRYEASYAPGTKPFGQGSGTVAGKGYCDTGTATYSKTVYVEVLEGSNAKPLMVYVKSSGSRSRPYYRVWQGTYWGGETAVQGATYIGLNPPDIRFIALSFDPGSDHAMLGMQDSQGRVWAQEWDGTAFASSGPTLVSSGGPTDTRAFDIAYENAPLTTGGANRAILVYAGETGPEERHVPYFRVWTGSAWLDAQEVPHIPDGMSQPSFIELATNPMTTGSRSKEIGMIFQDSDGRVFGEVWNGYENRGSGDWIAPRSSVWATTAHNSGRAVGVAYQNDGTLVFGYGEGSVGNSRLWNGTPWPDHPTEYQFTANNRTIQWLTMNSVPGTNVVVATYVTSEPRLYSSTLTGTSWDSTTVPAWASSTPYDVGGLVTRDGVVYECRQDHISNNDRRPPNATYWRVVPAWGVVPGWSAAISYRAGDFVTSSGTVYEYIHSHSSAGNAPPNSDYWRTTRAWASSTSYDADDLVTRDGVVYECRQDHTSNNSRRPPNATYWQPLPDWGTATYHSGDPGDLVTFDGTVYECISNHPSASQGPPNSTYWQVWSSGRAVADLGTVYSDTSPYFAFASSGADNGTVVFSSVDSELLYRIWTGGKEWSGVQELVRNRWTPSYCAVAAPDSQTTLSAYYPDARFGGGGNGDDEDEVQSIVGWHTTNSAGTWVESSFDGDPASHAYERIAIAIPAASGSGFTVVAGTWRESY